MINRLKTNNTLFGIIFLGILAFALPITLLLIRDTQDLRGSAALPDQLESESGVLSSSGVSKQTDSGASGGQYVSFNRASSPSPTSLPSGTYYYPPAPSGGDDRSSLQSFINGLPNGTAENPTLAIFAPTDTYSISGRLEVNNKSYVYFYGMDPSAVWGEVQEDTSRTRINNTDTTGGNIGHTFRLLPTLSHVKFIGFHIVGANSANYQTLNQFNTNKQSATAFHYFPSSGSTSIDNVEIAYNKVEYTWGHMAYFHTYDGVPALTDLNIHHNILRGCGTQGINVANGTRVYIDDNKIYNTGIFPINFEDAGIASSPGNGSFTDLYVRRNLLDGFGYNSGYYNEHSISSGAYIPHTNVYIQDNIIQNWVNNGRCSSTNARIHIRPRGGYRGTNINVTGNQQLAAKDGVQVNVGNSDGVTVTGNFLTGSATNPCGGSNTTDVVLTSSGSSSVTSSPNNWLAGPF